MSLAKISIFTLHLHQSSHLARPFIIVELFSTHDNSTTKSPHDNTLHCHHHIIRLLTKVGIFYMCESTNVLFFRTISRAVQGSGCHNSSFKSSVTKFLNFLFCSLMNSVHAHFLYMFLNISDTGNDRTS